MVNILINILRKVVLNINKFNNECSDILGQELFIVKRINILIESPFDHHISISKS